MSQLKDLIIKYKTTGLEYEERNIFLKYVFFRLEISNRRKNTTIRIRRSSTKFHKYRNAFSRKVAGEVLSCLLEGQI